VAPFGINEVLSLTINEGEGRHARCNLQLDIDGAYLDAFERNRRDALDHVRPPPCRTLAELAISGVSMVDTTNTIGSSDKLLAESAKAGAPEVEITPAMIEAGVDCFYSHDPRIDSIEEILPSIFRAMTAAGKAA
jgi:hypothetical protein